MKVLASLRPGIVVFLVAIALYAIPIRWIETRRFMPLDTPVSVSNGHFRPSEFAINLGADYHVDFYRPANANPEYSDCPYEASISAKWILFENGQPITVSVPAASGDYPWRRIDSFAAGPGTYSIDVEVLPGTECLNVARMRLMVWTYDGEYKDLLNFLNGTCVFLVGVGIVLLLRSSTTSFDEQSDDPRADRPHIPASPGYSGNFTARRRTPMPRFHGLPDFGVIYIASTLPLLILSIVIFSEMPRSMGLKVHLLRPNEIHMDLNARIESLRVSLNTCGEFFVNDERVSREELRSIVKSELGHRADSTVYFEADDNAQFQDAAFAMNEIRLASGKVVWLTPKTKSEIASQK
jgi:biopolymer transport protein ExbD